MSSFAMFLNIYNAESVRGSALEYLYNSFMGVNIFQQSSVQSELLFTVTRIIVVK